MVDYLMTLLGHSNNPEGESSFSGDATDILKQIPEKITAPIFAEDIAGLSTE